jgi:hypothetical protein
LVDHDRVLAHVAWNVADNLDEQSVRNARIALRRHMRSHHPGKKYRIVQTYALNGKTAAWMAVRLDG